MVNFIDELKDDITTAMPDVSPDWAEINAIMALSTILGGVKIEEREGLLPLNLLAMMIGPPGIKKSLPMFRFTKPIIENTGDYLLPSRSSVEGFIKYVSEKEKGKFLHNEGIIIRDEFGGLFNQIRSTDWQSDAMEFISEMYDGTFQKRMTVSGGLHNVETLYATMLTATTYQFVTRVDPEFFIQGTGNRFLYIHYSAEDYKPIKNDESYFFKEWGYEHKKVIQKYATLLKNLKTKIKSNWVIQVSDSSEWLDYKFKCETEWKEKCIRDPLGWMHHPIKRYPELALKLGGIYQISEYIESIPRMPEKFFDNFPTQSEAIEKGISMVERCRRHFEEIVKVKLKSFPREEPKSLEDVARAFMAPLLDGKTMTMMEWYEKQTVTSDNNRMQKLKAICIEKGWVVEKKDGRHSFVSLGKGT
jgi:hypothetical protein